MSRRLDALRAMAAQDDSPNERDIARAKLETMGAWPPPPPPPAPPAAAAPEPDYAAWWRASHPNATAAASGWSGTVAGANGTFYFIRIVVS